MAGKPVPVIGITGRAGAGKSTLADYIEQRYPKMRRGSFAKNVKRVCTILCGVNVDLLRGADKERPWRNGITYRQLMQRVGNELREIIGDDVWVHSFELSHGTGHVVIDDVRYPNEASYVRERGGVVIMVTRQGLSPVGDPGHPSEAVELIEADFTVANDGSPAQMVAAVEDFLTRWRTQQEDSAVPAETTNR